MQSKSKPRRSYSLQKIKFCLEFLINHSYFLVVSKIFRKFVGILMGSDPASFFANLFFFYQYKWLKSIENANNVVARTFGSIFRFIGNLIAVNNGNVLENYYSDFLQLILKKENTSHRETNFLDLLLYINEGQIQASLYDKRDSYNFNNVRL